MDIEKRASYLYERKYDAREKKAEIDNNKMKYWSKLLGKDTVEMLLKHNIEFCNYLHNTDFQIQDKHQEPFRGEKTIFYISGSEADEYKRYYESIDEYVYFPQFYEQYIEEYSIRLHDMLGEKESNIAKEVKIDLAKNLVEQLQMICIRTLIKQMHTYKNKGVLQGNSSAEEYDYFCRNIVGKMEFRKTLYRNFPVLERCIKDKVEALLHYYLEIIENFEEDKREIIQSLCFGKVTNRIVHIVGEASDIHHHGKQVVKIRLDNGFDILYKPHEMKNEKWYEEILRWFSEKTGINQYYYSIIVCRNHSWCMIVDYKSCESELQMKNYYKRIGIHIFITYLLGTKDLHYENVIASGEYPVLIDLEMLFGMDYGQPRESAEQEIRYRINRSVLMSGLLPFFSWNQEGKGINLSAISGESGQEYPFLIPTIENGGTSDMHISYKKGYSVNSKNLAKIKEDFVEPLTYEKEIEEGFRKAYKAAMNYKKELVQVIMSLQKTYSRVLMADTQRYSMLLSASYYPDLLRDGADREIFLHSLWQGRNEKQIKVICHEVKNLLYGDIPFFYIDIDDTIIYSRGREIGKIDSDKTVRESICGRIRELSVKDMENQCDYIMLSLELSDKKKEHCKNKVYYVDNVGMITEKWNSKKINPVKVLTDRLINHAVWNKERTDVSWEIINFSSSDHTAWDIRPVNYYLYSGLAGIFVLLYAIIEINDTKEVKDMFHVVRKKLFEYTDNIQLSQDNLMTRDTGLYEGESSIAYSYLILYKYSHEEIYLQNAKKHMEVVNGLVDEDQKYDLIYGNAGAAYMLLELYFVTNESQYIKEAEHVAKLLKASAVIMDKGIGWKVNGKLKPMAGMAHGNAGIILPIIILWRLTGKNEYQKMAEEIWQYEEFLYDPQINNWVDIRNEKKEVKEDSVAWCHGAAGILLSRLICRENVEDIQEVQCKKQFEKDIMRAYKKLENCWKRESWCLCHGTCGNQWILEKAEKKMGKENVGWRRKWIENEMSKEIWLLPQEKINPGMMGGYGGVLYWLIKGRDK